MVLQVPATQNIWNACIWFYWFLFLLFLHMTNKRLHIQMIIFPIKFQVTTLDPYGAKSRYWSIQASCRWFRVSINAIGLLSPFLHHFSIQCIMLAALLHVWQVPQSYIPNNHIAGKHPQCCHIWYKFSYHTACRHKTCNLLEGYLYESICPLQVHT